MNPNAVRHSPRVRMRTEEGIALLVTLLIITVLLGISSSLLNVTLKQYQLSGIAYASEMAFQAANAGMECAVYHDLNSTTDFDPVRSGTQGPFDVPGDNTVQNNGSRSFSCMNVSVTVDDRSNRPTFVDTNETDGRSKNGTQQNFQFNWGTPGVCVDVSVYKFYSTGGSVERWIENTRMADFDCDRGSVCTIIQSRGYNVPCAQIHSSNRVVEREYTQVY